MRERRTPLDVLTLEDYVAGRGVQLPLEDDAASGQIAVEVGDGLVRFNDEVELRKQRKRLLAQMRKSVNVKSMAWFDGSSDLINSEMVAALDLKLSVRHAMTGMHVQGKAFEALMEEAYIEARMPVLMIEDDTNVGYDLLVNDRVRLSLKTEKSKTPQPHQMTLTKLMEANWCKDIKTRPDVARLLPKILEHIDTWDRMLVLRASQLPKRKGWIYELLEIPKETFGPIEDMNANSFSVPTVKHNSRAHVEVDGQRMYSLVVDGSVGKITIAGLRTELCPLHALWYLPGQARTVVRPRTSAPPTINPQVHIPEALADKVTPPPVLRGSQLLREKSSGSSPRGRRPSGF